MRLKPSKFGFAVPKTWKTSSLACTCQFGYLLNKRSSSKQAKQK